jgi:hypothetical protein
VAQAVTTATPDAEIRKISKPGQIIPRVYPKYANHKKGLVEWFKQ